MTGRLRPGLRARITVIYALGALLVSSTVAVVGFALVQRELLLDAEAAALGQVENNARDIRTALQNQTPEAIEEALEEQPEPDSDDEIEAPGLDFENVLTTRFNRNNARELLIIQDEARSTFGLQERDLPSDVLALVNNGGAAKRRTIDASNGQPRLTVGVYIAQLDASYFEVSSLQPLQDTLASLRNTLIGVALGAGLAGAALGYYSTRRALQPVVRVARAAQAIASGDFGTRLDPSGDPDLAPLTTSFNDMVGALESRIERDERFASDVSHELRSPLMTLSASIGVLEHRRDELSPEAVQAVDLLSKDLQRFTRLVEDLLEISRLDVGAAAIDASPLVLEEFLTFAAQQSRTPNVPIVSDRHDTVIIADKRRLAQVIQNLIDNAAKYGDGATGVGFDVVGDQVQIYVEDRGPGVPIEDRERIFDRFTRAGADAGRRDVAKGVGLGLSLVAEHVRLHGGRVWVRDRPDGRSGAHFVVELPIGDLSILDEEMAS